MNNLKKIREAKGYTQEQLADAIGTKKQYISSLETGARNIYAIRMDTMNKLCGVLECTADDLVRLSADEFEFDDNGKLIIDGGYSVGNLTILDIGGNYYIAPPYQAYYNSREQKKITEWLKPYAGKVPKDAFEIAPIILNMVLDCKVK